MVHIFTKHVLPAPEPSIDLLLRDDGVRSILVEMERLEGVHQTGGRVNLGVIKLFTLHLASLLMLVVQASEALTELHTRLLRVVLIDAS